MRFGYLARSKPNAVTDLLNYIDGSFQPARGGQWLDNVEPATGRNYSRIPRSGSDDVQQAVAAAKRAFLAWSSMPATERSAIMGRVADLVGQNLDRLAAAESKDNGKPVSLAKAVDIPRAEANMRFYASAIVHYGSEAHITDVTAVNYTHRKPLGVVGCISPWNLPLYLFTWKIAPALAAGNTVVAKPSEVTPMTAFLFSELCKQAGLPDGVLNILHGLGPEVGQAMVEHPEITAISFTGGTATGKRIAATAAPMFKKLSLELGGKNPNIIFADCDFDEMLRTTMRSSFANQGQICLCGSRILIEASIYDKFKEAFVAKVERMQVGDPADPNTRMGALVSKTHLEKVESYIQLAREEGGTVLTGGTRPEMSGDQADGYFLRPTVIEGLGPNCRTNTEEIFGPVVTLQKFETDEEAVALANATEYGLAASVWTQNATRAHRFAAALESGIVWINCWLLRDLRTPFGGVKASGVGREGGFEALHFFTEPQNVCIKL